MHADNMCLCPQAMCIYAHQVQNDVSSAHERGSLQRPISIQQHHVLKALLLEIAPGHIVVPRHHAQRCRLRPIWHAAQQPGRHQAGRACLLPAWCFAHARPAEMSHCVQVVAFLIAGQYICDSRMTSAQDRQRCKGAWFDYIQGLQGSLCCVTSKQTVSVQ